MKDLTSGNIILIICASFYLLWWCIAFYPQKHVSRMITIPLIAFAAAAGLVGLYVELRGIANLHLSRSLYSGLFLAGTGVIAYIVLMAVSSLIFKRTITTELILIVGWVILQMAYVNSLYGSLIVSKATAIALITFIIIAGIISLIAYMAYYHLPPIASYIDGMIPLILVIVMMIVTTVLSI